MLRQRQLDVTRAAASSTVPVASQGSRPCQYTDGRRQHAEGAAVSLQESGHRVTLPLLAGTATTLVGYPLDGPARDDAIANCGGGSVVGAVAIATAAAVVDRRLLRRG